MRDSYLLYTDKLTGEYKDVFCQIEHYVSAERVDEDTQENYMSELLDIFLNAQTEERPIENIIGKNIESFCKTFCSNFTWQHKILREVETWKNFTWIVFLAAALDMMFLLYDMSIPNGREIDFWTEPCTFHIFGYCMGFMAASILISVMETGIRKMMFRMKKVSMKVWKFCKWMMYMLLFGVIFSGLTLEWIPMMKVPVWTLMLGSGLVLVFYYSMCFVYGKREIDVQHNGRNKKQEIGKIRFWQAVQNNVHEKMNATMEKKFSIKNKWRKRFGRKQLTWEDYIRNEEKDCQWCEKIKCLCVIMPIGLCLYMIGTELLFTEMILWADLILCVAFVGIVEAILMYVLYKSLQINVEERMKWIANAKKSDSITNK